MPIKPVTHKDVLTLLDEYIKTGKDAQFQKTINVVAAAIRAYRKRHHLTQRDLALKIGVRRLQIIRWEKGKNKVRVSRDNIFLLVKHKIVPKSLEIA